MDIENSPFPPLPRARLRPRRLPLSSDVVSGRSAGVVQYRLTGEVLKWYPTLRGARTAATRFNRNAGGESYCARPV